MNIRTFKQILGDVYQVSINTEEWSEGDNELMASYGEPEVDLGGDFTGPPAFTLPTNFSKIKSGSPMIASFDGQDFVDAEQRADVWASEMITRIKAEIDVLRSNSDTFTGEDVEQY